MSIQSYVSHPFAAREGVAEFANNPHAANDPGVLQVLASHHEAQASTLDSRARGQYQDPDLRGDRAERAAFASFAQSRGHREAATILRGLL